MMHGGMGRIAEIPEEYAGDRGQVVLRLIGFLRPYWLQVLGSFLLILVWAGAPLRHIIWGPDCYVVPWVDGTVLVGATVEDVGFDERTTAAGVRDLLDAVCDLLPAAWGATFSEARAGLRPATADGLPIIGPSAAVPGVTYATGHYRNGILLAPATALLVADLILDNRVDPALQFFQPSRFSAYPGRS